MTQGREVVSIGTPLIVIIRDMETGGAPRRLRVLSPTAVIELGSIGRIVWSQFVVPATRSDKKASVAELDLSMIKRVESNEK